MKEIPPLVAAHLECANLPFDSQIRPDGYINFGTAENKVLEREILGIFNEEYLFLEPDLHYNGQEGSFELRGALSRHLSQALDYNFDPNKLAIASGASAILEMISMCLLDSGDKIFVPGPFYAGFIHDFEVRFSGQVITAEVIKPEGLDFDRLHKELQTHRPKLFMLNHPQNPTGYVYTESEILRIADLCTQLEIQIIADEIYAQSVHRKDVKFCSALKILKTSNAIVHWVYGMAKDFGLSGIKVGVFYSEDDLVAKAMQSQCYFHTVSGSTQRSLIHLFKDDVRLLHLMDENRKRLSERYELVQQFCLRHQIKLFPSSAGIFAYLNLYRFMKDQSSQGEFLLFREVLQSAKVNISPGQFFKAENMGWFRLCFAQDLEVLRTGLLRLDHFLREKN